MTVLIVENEIYLAQSIAAKLSEKGFHCEIITTFNEAMAHEGFDIILVSTNISGNLHAVIKKHSEAIVILLVSYVSSDTVANPLEAGARDYIVKPFMIEELLRKIEHYQDYERIQLENSTLQRYLKYSLEEYEPESLPNQPLPYIIQTNHQKLSDSFAFELAKKKKLPLEFLCASQPDIKAQLEASKNKKNRLLYVAGLDQLKKSERQEVLAQLSGLQAIVSTLDDDMHDSFHTVELKRSSVGLEKDTILPIDEYIKLVVTNNQDRYPDTELSKKLGMSRKSLWEKRKKYGIKKRK